MGRRHFSSFHRQPAPFFPDKSVGESRREYGREWRMESRRESGRQEDPNGYPSRPRFFAHRFLRLIAKVCAANIIGPEGCWLLTLIVLLEDAKRYTGPISFWNGQLYPLAGLRGERSLSRVRQRCVNAGWLHYIPATKSTAAVYWVMVPTEYNALPDGPCGEDPTELFPDKSVGESRRECGRNAVGMRYESGRNAVGKRYECGRNEPTFIPIPIPSPNKTSSSSSYSAPDQTAEAEAEAEEWRRLEEDFFGTIATIRELCIEERNKGTTPQLYRQKITQAIATANSLGKSLSNPIGAVVWFLKTGNWPTPSPAARSPSRPDPLTTLATKIIRQGRRDKRTAEEILESLSSAGIPQTILKEAGWT